MGAVLLDSLAEIAAPAWSDDCERAWSTAIGIVAAAMSEGAEAVAA